MQYTSTYIPVAVTEQACNTGQQPRHCCTVFLYCL